MSELEMTKYSSVEEFFAKSPLIPDVDTTKEDERQAAIVAIFLGVVLGIVYIATTVELFLFLFLFVIFFYLGVWVFYLHHWIYHQAEIEKSLPYKIATYQDGDRIGREKKREIREEWQYYRRDYSRYGEFVDLKLENKDFSSPLTEERKRELYDKRYSDKAAFELGEDLTKERLKGDEEVYLHFVNYYYDEFTRQAKQREEAGLGPKVDEELVEQERRELKRHFAGQRVENEAGREMLMDVFRAGKGIDKWYQEASEKLEEDENFTEERKEQLREYLERRYELLKKKQAIEEEEEEKKTDRWSGKSN